MIPAPLSRNDSHLVGPQPLDRDDFLAFVEALRLHRGIGHQKQHDEGVGHGQETTEHEDDLIGEERIAVDVSEPVGEETPHLQSGINDADL